MCCQSKVLKQHRKTMLSPQAPSQYFKVEGEDETKGWMHCGIWKTLASPQLTDVKVCVLSSLFLRWIWRQTLSSRFKCLPMWHTSRCAVTVKKASKIFSSNDTECSVKQIFTRYHFCRYSSVLFPLLLLFLVKCFTNETCLSPKPLSSDWCFCSF